MTAEVKTMAPHLPTGSVEMFVSLLLSRVRQEDDVESIVFALIRKDGGGEVASSGMEIRDLAFAARTMQLYCDDHIRRNADVDDGPVPDPTKPFTAA